MPCVIFALCVSFWNDGARLQWFDGASIALPEGFTQINFPENNQELMVLKHHSDHTTVIIYRNPLAKPLPLDEALFYRLLNIEVELSQPINSHPNRFRIESPLDLQGLEVFGENRIHETGNCWFIVLTNVELLASYRALIQKMADGFSPPVPLSIRQQEFNLNWMVWGLILLLANLAMLWVALFRFSQIGGSVDPGHEE